MLDRLDGIVKQTGLNAAATAGLLPGTANHPQVFGTLPGGALHVRSMQNASGGSPFTRIEASGLREPNSVLTGFAEDAAADKVPVLGSTLDGAMLRADAVGVLAQEQVARVIVKVANRLKEPA